MNATNRQKKMLQFFGVGFSQNITTGAAGWEIAFLMESDENRELWRKYLYLTKDFDSDSSELKDYKHADLVAIEVPEDWSAKSALEEYRHEIAANEVADSTPFDRPQPPIEFEGRRFMFTGKFGYGSRKACQEAVVARGGEAPSKKAVSRELDYLVVGCGGSAAWKWGAYGNKIESAVLNRREHGSPAIVSEEHWLSYLDNG